MSEQDTDKPLDGKYLGTISQDFLTVSDILKEAAYQIKVRGISEFPIFPIAKAELKFGENLVPVGAKENKWNYNFSFLDEFKQRGLIDEEKEAEFKSIYKNPEEFACFFVVEPDFMNFLFVPYPVD